MLTLFGAAEAQAQYWRPPPQRYWREAPPPPPRAYVVDRYGAAYRDAPPPPPPRSYRPGQYGAAYRDYPPPPLRAYRPRYRCDRGSGGTILGAIAGGLLGNRAAGRGDRGVGTVLGAGAGALVGREVDRGC
ncbi:hypothetical protein FHS31_001105 [Sphingomonas vulcanisoli]|uniref:17 kDa surface antigen n=1 Tax=Sphingomonas vulcanisoli TaxID=1658060 RepID=A0ABX0TPR0_9SPHN|nr:glycine zipper 2TM domain-containing protein [Sphingomonas vulcanisoli]NIJ07509.1 hypothetical protein [Sphingomonas vulcanisoli]